MPIATRVTRTVLSRVVNGAAIGVGACLVVAASGCAQKRISVEMDTTSGTATRSFASNALERGDVQRLTSMYASDPTRDAKSGDRRFTGSFESQLPSELGNRNGLARLTTGLGSAGFYFEALAAPAPFWTDLRARMDAGELWTRLFGRWAERGIEDSALREEWREYVERELIPLVCDAVLLWAVQSSTIRSTRVDQSLRDPADASPITEDERFVQRVGMPLVLMLSERGVLTANESQRLLLYGVDGRVTAAERTDALETILQPAFLRQARRFRPSMRSVETSSLVGIGLSFWLYATTSPDRNDILLASSAISEDDKSAIRAGRSPGVRLPPPFGFDPLGRTEPTTADVRLRTGGVEPFFHNGRWDPERRELVFASSFVPPDRRVTLFPPVFHASWAEPNDAAQLRIFGVVLLTGPDLAAYVLWADGLPTGLRRRWEGALERLAGTGAIDELAAIERETREEGPMPPRVSDWILKRAVEVDRARPVEVSAEGG